MDTLLERFESILKNISNSKLVHCINYECKETFGFLKHISNGSSSVAHCSPKSNTEYITKIVIQDLLIFIKVI